MTLVNIDLRNAGYETGPDDRVVFYSPANRNEQGTIISTAETSVTLVNGQAEKELAPGPVVVQILAQGVTDTRPKSGYVPEEGPVSLWDVVLDWTPALVDQGILAILVAVDDALGQVADAVAAEVDSIKWPRGLVPAGATLDSLAQGSWWVQGTSGDLGLPTSMSGTLLVYRGSYGYGNAVFYSVGPDKSVFVNRKGADGWRGWTNLYQRDATGYVAGTELEDLQSGSYYMQGTSGHVGLPINLSGILQVSRSSGGSGSAVFYSTADDRGVYINTRYSGGWRGWMNISPRRYAPLYVAGTPLEELPVGDYFVQGTSGGLGLPSDLSGILSLTLDSRGLGHAVFYSTADDRGVYVNTSYSGGWRGWVNTLQSGTGGSDTPAQRFPDPDAPIESNTERVVMWGDSLTYAGVIRDRLETLQPDVDFVNRGIGSQTAHQIAARQGGMMPSITLVGGVIPESGPIAVADISQRILLQTNYPARTMTGTICGIRGTLSNAPGTQNYVFTREDPGFEVAVPVGALFVPDDAMDSRRDAQIIWVGRNSPRVHDPASAIPPMLNWLTPHRKKVLVVSVTGSSWWVKGTPDYEAIVRANLEMQRLCGDSYVDLRRWLIDHGLDAIGVTPTQADLTAIAGDAIPQSLSTDGTHFTAEAQTAIANFLHGEMVARGWWSS